MLYPDICKVVLKFSGTSGLCEQIIHLPSSTVERISPLNLFRIEPRAGHDSVVKTYEILMKRYGDDCVEFLLLPTENENLEPIRHGADTKCNAARVVYSTGQIEEREFSCLPALGDKVAFNKMQYDVQQCCWVLSGVIHGWGPNHKVNFCMPTLFLTNCSPEKRLSFMQHCSPGTGLQTPPPSPDAGVQVSRAEAGLSETVSSIYQQKLESAKVALKSYGAQISRDVATEFSYHNLQARRKNRGANLAAFKALKAMTQMIPVPGLNIIVAEAIRLSQNKYITRCIEQDVRTMQNDSETSLRRIDAATHLKYKKDGAELIPLYWDTLRKYGTVSQSSNNIESTHFQLAARLDRLEELVQVSSNTLNSIKEDCEIIREEVERRAGAINFRIGRQSVYTVAKSPRPRRDAFSPIVALEHTFPSTSPLPAIGSGSASPPPGEFAPINSAPASPQRPKAKRPLAMRNDNYNPVGYSGI